MSKQRTSDDKAAYHTPALTAFGSLSTVTLAGTGTMAETNPLTPHYQGPGMTNPTPGWPGQCAGTGMATSLTMYVCF